MKQWCTVAAMKFPVMHPLCIFVKANADVAAVHAVSGLGAHCMGTVQ